MIRSREEIFRGLLGRPGNLVIAVFLGCIIFGAILLHLPLAHTNQDVAFVDILFTATSAVCVTGLTVLDTGKDFTTIGQALIMLLIQIGGLGIMSMGALAILMGRSRLSFGSQALFADTVFQKDNAQSVKRTLRSIIFLTFAVELIGALLLFACLPEELGFAQAAFTSLFHSVSAFCNAGFSTFSDNLIGLRSNFPVLAIIAALIISGGIGYPILLELILRFKNQQRRRYQALESSLTSRVAIQVSFYLIFIGAAFFILCGISPVGASWVDKMVMSLFHSITARTAGFNAVDIGGLSSTAMLILVLLMFVGGSPCSCAGGIKTTTAAVWFAAIRSQLKREKDVVIYGRRIANHLVRRAFTIISLAFVFNIVGVAILTLTEAGSEGATLEKLLFEQVSAFGTVGLSAGITAKLSTLGKFWIIISMFVGRIGPMTLGAFLIGQKVSLVRYPEEHILVG